MIDVTNIQIPSEYLVGIAITALFLGVVFGVMTTLWTHEKAVDRKMAKGKIQSANDLAYDNRYIIASILGAFVGMILAVGATPIIVQNYVIGGGMWTYITVVALLTPIMTVGYVSLFQWITRVSIVRYGDYRYVLKEEGANALTDEEKAIVNQYLVAHGKKPKF